MVDFVHICLSRVGVNDLREIGSPTVALLSPSKQRMFATLAESFDCGIVKTFSGSAHIILSNFKYYLLTIFYLINSFILKIPRQRIPTFRKNAVTLLNNKSNGLKFSLIVLMRPVCQPKKRKRYISIRHVHSFNISILPSF